MCSQLVSTAAVINIAVYLQIRRARPTARSCDDDGDDDDAESFIDRTTSRCSRGGGSACDVSRCSVVPRVETIRVDGCEPPGAADARNDRYHFTSINLENTQRTSHASYTQGDSDVIFLFHIYARVAR